MNNKKVKKAMKRYIEMQADHILLESEKTHDLSSLDEKVYATINGKQDNKISAMWSYKKIATLAASFILIIGLSITAILMLNKEPVNVAEDVCYSVTISYKNEQFGYYSNRTVIDKYNIEDISDMKQNFDLFTEKLNDTDIIHLDSVIDRDSIIGAKIYPYSDDVIILQNNGQFYFFEKIETK